MRTCMTHPVFRVDHHRLGEPTVAAAHAAIDLTCACRASHTVSTSVSSRATQGPLRARSHLINGCVNGRWAQQTSPTQALMRPVVVLVHGGCWLTQAPRLDNQRNQNPSLRAEPFRSPVITHHCPRLGGVVEYEHQ